ncbi:amino acid adenylation domain-containing protein [Micromonospora sp. NPDC048868]|uniref:non-ribosomal peptide synthetase n=1 Tax=Micromonospora sp. NPDC048868 TaxID=3364258 RepID=UPI0037196F77
MSPHRPWRSIVDRLLAVADSDPTRQALVHGSEVLDFGQLAARAGTVAAGLAARGVGPESLVGLLLPRSVDMVVALFGVLRSGAGYVPLDPALPPARLHHMCENARVDLVLCGSGPGALPDFPAVQRTVRLADCRRSGTAGGPPAPRIDPRHRAYALYTSGSTGWPKAVQVTYGSLDNLLTAMETVVGPPGARIGWNASLAFDASVQQWLRLCRGDTVVLLDDAVRRDPEALVRTIVEQRLTELDVTPTHAVELLDQLDARPLGQSLRLLVGGEAIAPSLWRRMASRRAAGALIPVNLYGPTECTVDVTAAPIDETGGPHLGTPLAGTRVYLLDASLRPVRRPGIVGELFVAGAGVARGYLGQPGLTARRFLPDVVAGDGTRMYRTGDLGRWNPAGRLEFCGRADGQLKVRGFRVEPGEVEAALTECPQIAQAVVTVREDSPGAAALVAYCRRADGHALDVDAVRRAVRTRLPEYMVPTTIVAVDALPRTANGKVDRAALPAASEPGPTTAAVPPLTGATQQLVGAAWREVLGVDRVGPSDNFFELGGQSVLAFRLVARLRRRIGRAIPLVAVFEHPVLTDLAAYIDQHDRVPEGVEQR